MTHTGTSPTTLYLRTWDGSEEVRRTGEIWLLERLGSERHPAPCGHPDPSSDACFTISTKAQPGAFWSREAALRYAKEAWGVPETEWEPGDPDNAYWFVVADDLRTVYSVTALPIDPAVWQT